MQNISSVQVSLLICPSSRESYTRISHGWLMALSVVYIIKLPLKDKPHVRTADFVWNSDSCTPMKTANNYSGNDCRKNTHNHHIRTTAQDCVCMQTNTHLRGHFSRTIWVNQHQKDKTILNFDWHMQIICTSLQTDNPIHHSIFTGQKLFLTPKQ